jgi:hypothetical protein
MTSETHHNLNNFFFFLLKLSRSFIVLLPLFKILINFVRTNFSQFFYLEIDSRIIYCQLRRWKLKMENDMLDFSSCCPIKIIDGTRIWCQMCLFLLFGKQFLLFFLMEKFENFHFETINSTNFAILLGKLANLWYRKMFTIRWLDFLSPPPTIWKVSKCSLMFQHWIWKLQRMSFYNIDI